MPLETFALDQQPDSRNPLGMSKFSLRRHSVRHFLLLYCLLILVIAINVQGILIGQVTMVVLAAAALVITLVMAAVITLIGIRSVAIEIWIRRLGMGDFEYRIRPWGRDELSQTCIALESLRQNSIRAMQLDTIRDLSNQLQDKNNELEQALTDLRASQNRIISQQKLAELGELSSGVAHEMRNPLQFIINFTSSSVEVAAELEGMLQRLEGAEREDASELSRVLKDNMERVLHHGSRANSIVSAMMIFDRGTGGGFRPVDLNQLLARQVDLARQAMKAYEPGFDVEVNLELDPALEEVVVIPEDIARVISNLTTNACESMAEKARLEGKEYRPELKVVSLDEDDIVTLLFQDNGAGMTQDAMAKMFNPFFTTRDSGRNTGLGLSLVHEVIREHGGDIEAESEPGKYTRIKVRLPRRPENGERAASENLT